MLAALLSLALQGCGNGSDGAHIASTGGWPSFGSAGGSAAGGGAGQIVGGGAGGLIAASGGVSATAGAAANGGSGGMLINSAGGSGGTGGTGAGGAATGGTGTGGAVTCDLNFPSFDGYEVVMSDPQPGRLFEASNVYKIEGMNEYLLLVEAYGPRYFRSWTSASLDGPWAPLADTQSNPFAGEANVTFEDGDWSNDVSHGEMIRAGHDQTMTIDACRLQFLYQGVDPNVRVSDYGLLPYRLGLLTRTP